MKLILIIRWLLLFPFLIATFYVDAQTEKKPSNLKSVNFGIKAGINVNRLETRIERYINENYMGFNGGVFARFNLTKRKRLHIQPELNFSMIGGEGFFENGGRYNIKSNTLELPVALGYKVLDFKLINVRMHAGPFASVSLSRSIYVLDPDFPSNSNFTVEKTPIWNGGFFIGLGGDIWRFTMDARYKFGFVNMLGSNVLVQDPGAGFKNGHFEFSLGFKIF